MSTASDPGPKPELRWIPCDKLVIDRTYQRDVDSAHAQRILRAFDWRFFQAATVTPIAGGMYAVLDGQHRIVAARSHPAVKDVPCVVVNAPSAQDQARSFLATNGTHKYVTPYEIFWAALTAQEPEYVALAALLDRCGIEPIPGGSGSPSHKTTALATIRRQVRRRSEPVVEQCLRAMDRAWPNQANVFVSRLIEALCPLVAELGSSRMDALVRALAKRKPDRLLNEARLQASDTGARVAEVIRQIIKAEMLPAKAAA